MIHIIGMGPGDVGYLTKEGERLLQKVEILVGGKRHLEAQRNFRGEKIVLGNNLDEVVNCLRQYAAKKEIGVLASGDPLVYGIGKYLTQHFPKEHLHIVSGISAVQYFFSRLQLDMNDLYITSSHGKVPDFDFLLAHEKVAMVTDGKIGPSEIAEEILKRGLNKILYIGENLSYKEECITSGKANEIIGKKYGMNVVVIVDEK